jgi:hypothetical protein
MEDEEICTRWEKASSLYHKGPLARRLAQMEISELEVAGVTESDIDRLFPLSPIQRWLRDEFVDASIDWYAYADAAERKGWSHEYVKSCRDLAAYFECYRIEAEEAGAKKGDPEAPPHRKDNPTVIAMMRHETDVAVLVDALDRANEHAMSQQRRIVELEAELKEKSRTP